MQKKLILLFSLCFSVGTNIYANTLKFCKTTCLEKNIDSTTRSSCAKKCLKVKVLKELLMFQRRGLYENLLLHVDKNSTILEQAMKTARRTIARNHTIPEEEQEAMIIDLAHSIFRGEKLKEAATLENKLLDSQSFLSALNDDGHDTSVLNWIGDQMEAVVATQKALLSRTSRHSRLGHPR